MNDHDRIKKIIDEAEECLGNAAQNTNTCDPAELPHIKSQKALWLHLHGPKVLELAKRLLPKPNDPAHLCDPTDAVLDALTNLRRKSNAVTPESAIEGWDWREFTHTGTHEGYQVHAPGLVHVAHFRRKEDADYICALYDIAPALVEALRAARAEIARLKGRGDDAPCPDCGIRGCDCGADGL